VCVLAQKQCRQSKGLRPSMLVPILITHNNETPFKHRNQKKIFLKMFV